MLKRCFDIFFSLGALIVFSPLLFVAALGNIYFLGFPIFYTQKRVGRNNKIFTIYKFRSMFSDESIEESSRIGKWGQFLRSTSIDELPELYNILKGEMSFVGPRPLLPEYIPFYSEVESQRHKVTPGLTGLAQIRGRNSISWKDKFSHDVEYVNTQSFFGDVKIIFLTIGCVFKRTGVNHSKQLTMHRFDDPLYIVGAGGHGKSVLVSAQDSGHDVYGFLDDSFGSNQRLNILGIELKAKPKKGMPGRAIIGIGNNFVRRKLVNSLSFKWETIIHPSATVHHTSIIGEGSVILANAHIGPDTKIGRHSIINTSSNIEHDCIIGDYCHIAPGATICGGSIIENNTFIGAGSTLIPQIHVNKNIVIGAGSTVINHLDKEATYLGTPAKELQMKKNKKIEVKDVKISMARPVIDQDDIDGVLEVLKSGHLSLGPKIIEFEKSFEQYTNCNHAIAVSSGTAGLHMIMMAMGIGKGDEVLVPSFTFVSSVSTILHVGATPVFVDIDEETYCLDPIDLESKMTTKTKAIMGVDIFGHPADWPLITKIAKKYGVYTIDDSCEALGACIDNQRIGSFADASTFAFYPNKQITTGEGGIIVTNHDLLAEKLRMLRNHGRSSMGGWLKHDFLGYNFRMDEMSASLGVTQMKKLDKILDGRESVALKYNKCFEEYSDIRTQVVKENVDMSWFVYVVTLSDGLDRDRIISSLHERQVPARAYFEPIHTQPFMDHVEHKRVELPITDNIAKRTIALPFHAMMTNNEIEYVAETLKTIVDEYKNEQKRDFSQGSFVA